MMTTARIEVLHALALAAGSREALPEAIEHLAADDPLLRPWAARLAPRLRQGEALGSALRHCRLVTRQEAALLDRAHQPAITLTRLAEGTFQVPWTARVAEWLPSVVAIVAGVAYLLGIVLEALALGPINRELGILIPTFDDQVMLVMGMVTAVVATQAVVRQVRGLRWFLVPPFIGLHRALALVELHRSAREDVIPSWLNRAWSVTRMGAQRHQAPTWDLPWRTWWMLTRWRLTAGQRQAVHDLEDPLQRLRGLGVGEPAVAKEALEQEVAAIRPWVAATLVIDALLGVSMGFFSPLIKILESIGGGGS